MTQTLLPPEAPFEGAQREFAEGFLQALDTIRRAQSTADTASDAPGAPLTILYGSQSGNCEALSKELRKTARNRGFDPQVVALDTFDVGLLGETQHLLILCSTFGEGDPPDNAKKFHAWLESGDAPELPGLSYSVCALGDRSYTFFCKAGIDIDERLAELGATRLADRVECDVDYDEDYASWKEAIFANASMLAAAEAAGGPVGDLEEEPDEPATAGNWSKQNPFPARILKVRTLNAPGSAKEVNHVEICLAGSGLDYEVGDALGLWPVNCGEQVEQILEAGGFTGEELVHFKGTPLTLRAALLAKVDLHVLTPVVREKLGLPVEDDWLRNRHLIDLLAELAPTAEPQALVDALRPLQPRLYSIASSPKAHPQQVHLTVGAVRYDLHGRPRKGVASTFLADRVQPGSSVGVFLQKSAHFRLPDDGSTPVVMVGPGTGIAPFRAFLEERLATGATGPNWLFFGDQRKDYDFLYGDWLTNCVDDGRLARLDLAWSRDGSEKVYVQHLMERAGEELFRWLEDGAHFYVCGDASRMANDVHEALKTVVATHGGLSDDEAAAYVARLAEDHRYQRDVY